MSFRLFSSNRMETLSDSLIKHLKHETGSVFMPETIVVQSKGMERWIKMQLANKIGIAANIKFPFPKAFITGVLDKTVGLTENDLFSPEVLCWRIYAELDNILKEKAPGYEPLKDYLNDSDSDKSIKRFQLARQLAAMYDDYLIFRPEMMLEWSNSHRKPGFYSRTKLDVHDEWQRLLWQRLLRDVDDILPERIAMFLGKKDIESNKGLSAAIHLFGISSLPPIYLIFLEKLAEIIDINIYYLTPSKEYLDDIVTEKQAIKKTLESDDQGYWDVGHPLLASMGMLTRDYSRLLHGLNEVEDKGNFDESGQDTLLHRIQNDMLYLKNPIKDPKERMDFSKTDKSIHVHVCHSPMREVEVLYDQILAMLEELGIQPRDILVMTPDIQKYAPYIHAVFDNPESKELAIPFSIADRTPMDENPVAKAFLNILKSLNSRYTAGDVMEIFECPAVYKRFGIEDGDLDIIRKWVTQSGIRWGIDEGFRGQATGVSFNENSWEFGMDRLILGYAMPADVGLYHDILPVDVEGNEAQILGRFLAFLRQLFGLRNRIAVDGVSVQDWEEFLYGLVNGEQAFFASTRDTEDDLSVVLKTIHKTVEPIKTAGYDKNVTLDVIIDALSEELGDDAGTRGFLHGGVTFCRMRPMRSIPARVICLIGMNEGEFPRVQHATSFNLVARNPKIGDRNPRYDDRNLFLETLISTRDCLYISYIGRSIKDNAEIPPSVIVSEFLDYIRDTTDFSHGKKMEDFLITIHPLQAFSPRYFVGDDGLFSYSRANLNGAMGPVATAENSDTNGTGHTNGYQPEKEISFHELLSFLKHPVKYYFQHRLGVYLDDEGSFIPQNDEPMDLKGIKFFKKQQIIEEFVEGSPDTSDKETQADKLRGQGMIPVGDVGMDECRGFVDDLADFAQGVVQNAGNNIERKSLELKVNLKVKSDDRLLIGMVNWQQNTDGDIVIYRYSKNKSDILLHAWLTGLALIAAGESVSQAVCEFKKDKNAVGSKILMFPSKTEAFDILSDLIALFDEGIQDVLPVFLKPSMAYTEKFLKSNDQNEAIEKAKKEWMPYYNTDFKSPSEDLYNSMEFEEDFFDRESEERRKFEELAKRVFEPIIKRIE